MLPIQRAMEAMIKSKKETLTVAQKTVPMFCRFGKTDLS